MTQELRTIRLFGHLGKRFGKVHHYAISSPAEAVRAMSCTIPGFREYVGIDHARSGFRVLVGSESVGVERLGEISGGQEIHIVPVVRGAKKWGQVIIGAVLITAAVMLQRYELLPKIAGYMMSTGIAMALGGIAGLIASPPNPLNYGAGEDGRPSNYLFNGSNQATPSGGPMPVLYGRLEIPLVLISGSITPEQSSYGLSQFGMLGDGLGNWSGDGNTVPLAASIRETL